MNSFELNKILGAVLGTCLVLLALNIGAGALFSPEKPAKPGYNIAVKEEHGGAPAAAQAPSEPIEKLLASASVEKGQATAKQCAACHTFEKGGPNRVGPNLWDIVGHPRGEGRGGFNFSAAMKAKGGTWSKEEEAEFKAPTLKQFDEQSQPYYATARLWDDGLIDPVDTRRILGMAISASLNVEIPDTKFGVYRM